MPANWRQLNFLFVRGATPLFITQVCGDRARIFRSRARLPKLIVDEFNHSFNFFFKYLYIHVAPSRQTIMTQLTLRCVQRPFRLAQRRNGLVDNLKCRLRQIQSFRELVEHSLPEIPTI